MIDPSRSFRTVIFYCFLNQHYPADYFTFRIYVRKGKLLIMVAPAAATCFRCVLCVCLARCVLAGLTRRIFPAAQVEVYNQDSGFLGILDPKELSVVPIGPMRRRKESEFFALYIIHQAEPFQHFATGSRLETLDSSCEI